MTNYILEIISKNFTNKEEAFNKSTKLNYIRYFSSLVASNINALYYYYKNNHNNNLDTMIRSSQDMFNLNLKEQQELYKLIEKKLEEDYHLKIIQKDKLALEEIK